MRENFVFITRGSPSHFNKTSTIKTIKTFTTMFTVIASKFGLLVEQKDPALVKLLNFILVEANFAEYLFRHLQ